MDTEKKKVALLFGSFNPIHIGHFAILRYILSHYPQCEVRLVVSPESPFKKGLIGSSEKRLADARAAMEASGLNVLVSDVEYHLEPPLYTINTLRHLRKTEPEKEHILVVGGDNIAGIGKWHESAALLSEFEIWVYPREGYDAKAACEMYNDMPGTKCVRYLNAPLYNISSTEIRAHESSPAQSGDSSSENIRKALGKAVHTRDILVGRGVIGETARIFSKQFPGRDAIIVADTTTQKFAQFLGLGDSMHLFASGIPAEWQYVEQLEDALRASDAIPVALGSGTINDLTKLAASRCGRDYMTVATAVSMDGYTSFGASITKYGVKQTFPCKAPKAVVADIDVIATAPSPVFASGYADLLAKIPAGADWILADALGEEPLDPVAFSIAQDGLHDALNNPEGVQMRDPRALKALTEGLLLSGLAMQAYPSSSRPASGAEHQFSHLWTMQHHTLYNGHIPSHGFQVSIGTLTSLAYYEQLLKCDFASLDIEAALRLWPSFVREEYISPKKLRCQLETLVNKWDIISRDLKRQLISVSEAQKRLKEVGAPTKPEDIDIPRRRLRDCVMEAHYIRPRFTILDVALRTGKFDEWTESIFGKGGLWPIA